jgi:hypothetical protein
MVVTALTKLVHTYEASSVAAEVSSFDRYDSHWVSCHFRNGVAAFGAASVEFREAGNLP